VLRLRVKLRADDLPIALSECRKTSQSGGKMKNIQSLLLLIAGALLCLVVQGFFKVQPARAAGQLSNGSVCVGQIPAAWGEYKGSSDYGLAFEDEKGTLRFVSHPPCGIASSSDAVAAPTVDLKLDRR
jgi:hypothetical protein